MLENANIKLSTKSFFLFKNILFKLLLNIFSISLLPILTTFPSLGAEKIIFNYGLLEESIPISSLETYVKTGEVDEDLAAYRNYIGENQLAILRKVLVTPIPLNQVEVAQFLYTPIGERLLKRLGNVIQTESSLSGFYAIRAALILSAADEKEFTLLNVLRQFPTNAVAINLSQSLEIINTLQSLVNQTQNAVAIVNQQAQTIDNNIKNNNINNNSIDTLQNISLTNLGKAGNFRFSKQTITLNDLSRLRQLPTDIYLPITQTPRPIIFISHGLGSDRTSFTYLAEHLASYGFVVVVPEHPGSDAQQLEALLAGVADQVTNPRELINRPLDIKFVLDQLTRLAKDNPSLRKQLNLEQIGVIGQSFGGYTALALAGAKINFEQLKSDCPALEDNLNISLLLQCLAVNLPNVEYNLADARIKVAIAINPIDSTIFGKTGLSQIKIPLMIVSSSADTVAPALPEQIRPFTWLTTANKYLALINGGTHFSTIAESSNRVVPIPRQVIGNNPALARRYLQALSVPFLTAYLSNQPSYRSYLSQNYINQISQPSLPLSLITSLTSEQLEQAVE